MLFFCKYSLCSLSFDLSSLRLPRPELLPLIKESQTVHFYGTGWRFIEVELMVVVVFDIQGCDWSFQYELFPGDWDLCHTSLSNFTQSAEDMVECKEVNIFDGGDNDGYGCYSLPLKTF